MQITAITLILIIILLAFKINISLKMTFIIFNICLCLTFNKLLHLFSAQAIQLPFLHGQFFLQVTR